MPASTILVIHRPTSDDESIAPILTTPGYTVTDLTDLDEGFARVVEHQLLVIDLGAPSGGGHCGGRNAGDGASSG